MKYKAIFFDRDGTLTYNDQENKRIRADLISSWSGKPFTYSEGDDYDLMMSLFTAASEGRTPWYHSVDEEREFYRRYYRILLKREGVTDNIERRADTVVEACWCKNEKLPYPETVDVLRYFKSRGFKMGVISDTSPSLELTLVQAGLAEYFTSFTASSLVGASKPDPVIFNAALNAQGVTADECLYVDDYDVEADGARKLGFTSFYLDRINKSPVRTEWKIKSLTELVDFAESNK